MIKSNNFNSQLENEFSIKKVVEFTDNDDELIKDTLLLMKETFTDDLISLKSLTSPLQTKSIKMLAHKIKPNFDLIGLNSLFKICNQLETKSLSDQEYQHLSELIFDSKDAIVSLLQKSIDNPIINPLN